MSMSMGRLEDTVDASTLAPASRLDVYAIVLPPYSNNGQLLTPTITARRPGSTAEKLHFRERPMEDFLRTSTSHYRTDGSSSANLTSSLAIHDCNGDETCVLYVACLPWQEVDGSRSPYIISVTWPGQSSKDVNFSRNPEDDKLPMHPQHPSYWRFGTSERPQRSSSQGIKIHYDDQLPAKIVDEALSYWLVHYFMTRQSAEATTIVSREDGDHASASEERGGLYHSVFGIDDDPVETRSNSERLPLIAEIQNLCRQLSRWVRRSPRK